MGYIVLRSETRRVSTPILYYKGRISDVFRAEERGSPDPKGRPEVPYLLCLRTPERGVTEPGLRLHARLT
jgi:hypothetical protein